MANDRHFSPVADCSFAVDRACNSQVGGIYHLGKRKKRGWIMAFERLFLTKEYSEKDVKKALLFKVTSIQRDHSVVVALEDKTNSYHCSNDFIITLKETITLTVL